VAGLKLAWMSAAPALVHCTTARPRALARSRTRTTRLCLHVVALFFALMLAAGEQPTTRPRAGKARRLRALHDERLVPSQALPLDLLTALWTSAAVTRCRSDDVCRAPQLVIWA
jgi:hypothetical protein